MAEGFYSVEYWKGDDVGFGLFVLRNGRLLGCDIAGGSYTGTYKPTTDHGYFEAEAMAEFEGGVPLIFGVTTPEDGMAFPLRFTIQKYPGPTVFVAETPLGPVNYRLNFLRPATWLDALTA